MVPGVAGAWQRCFHLVRLHLDAGETLPTTAGEVVRQGEDLGRWVTTVRHGWDHLTGVQQWMCEQILGIEPVTEAEKPKPRTSQMDIRLVSAVADQILVHASRKAFRRAGSAD
ncbi:hypothetical protein [Streptomyces sp. NPDC051109]|uniref:hypothetical protein n=1 Tax=Streptomyces sp. NPDC051109 TaxID=3365642 RepID=UPI0026D7E2EE